MFEYNFHHDSDSSNSQTDTDVNPNFFLFEDATFFKQEIHEDLLSNLTEFIGWTEKAPQDWTSEDVLDWVYTVDCYKQVGPYSVQLENFRDVDGKQLCSMSRNEFLGKDPINGARLHSLITDLTKKYQIFGCLSEADESCLKEFLKIDSELVDYFNNDSSATLPNISSFINPSFNDGNHSNYFFTPPSTPSPTLHNFDHNYNSLKEISEDEERSSGESSIAEISPVKLRKQSKRDAKELRNKHFVKRPKKTKATHLWKFMRSLLDDPTYNPTFIKWENKEKGVFRIVPGQSKSIAKLWGMKKNNPTMTFDKLSRSLRWCREYGFLSKVPNNEGFPKKLCFRFGERAMDWDGN